MSGGFVRGALMYSRTGIPDWLAPWICAAVFAVLGWDSLSVGQAWKRPTGVAILFGFAAFGFAIGIAFWLRDRRRGR